MARMKFIPSSNIDNLEMPSPKASVVERIKYLIRLTRNTQASFGKLICVDPSNMSKVITGRIPATDGFINRIVVNLGVSKDWLLNGTDVPFPKNPHETTLIENGPGISHHKGAPVYDIDATAGAIELSREFTNDRIIGFLDMPNINTKNPIIRVSGNSMAPKIPDGSYISIRQISNLDNIFWGNVYLVVTEDYRMVKVVRKDHSNKDNVILHSYNPEYDDMEISRKDILNLFMVDAVLNYNIFN